MSTGQHGAMARLLLLALLLALSAVSADQSDTDTASVSDTSGTSDIDTDLDNNDPNLHNPIVSVCDNSINYEMKTGLHRSSIISWKLGK